MYNDKTYSSTKMNRRDFRKVHRGKTTVKTAIDTGKQSAGNQHFVRVGHFRKTHEKSGNNSEYVVKQ